MKSLICSLLIYWALDNALMFEPHPSRDTPHTVRLFFDKASVDSCVKLRKSVCLYYLRCAGFNSGRIILKNWRKKKLCSSDGFFGERCCERDWRRIFRYTLTVGIATEAHGAMNSVIMLLLLLLSQSFFMFAVNCSQCVVRRLLLGDMIECYVHEICARVSALSVRKKLVCWTNIYGQFECNICFLLTSYSPSLLLRSLRSCAHRHHNC